MCVSGGKKCLFFEYFGVLCFLETPVLRFAPLPYYRRVLFASLFYAIYLFVYLYLFLVAMKFQKKFKDRGQVLGKFKG